MRGFQLATGEKADPVNNRRGIQSAMEEKMI
jgi:hypothetical protein